MKKDLERINQAFKTAEATNKRKEKIRQKEKEIEDRENEKLLRLEEKIMPYQEKFYRRILEWRDEFVETEQCEEIFKMKRIFGKITIFYGGWGHKIPYRREHGCWSRLDLDKHGELIYVSGYKWMGSSERINLEDGVGRFSPAYIKEVYDQIENGKVYETIASRIEELSKFF